MPLNVVLVAREGSTSARWGDGAPPPAPPATGPLLATLSGASSVIIGSTHTSTVSLDVVADQTYTITWARSDGGTGPATSTITPGNATATGASTWASAGTSRTVDFTISPSVTRAGNPLSLTVIPIIATLTGSSVATALSPHTSTVTLSSPADQTYTITWARSNGATGVSSSTITTGNSVASATSTWPDGGAGRTVGFSISPSISKVGDPLTVTVAAAPATTLTLSTSTTTGTTGSTVINVTVTPDGVIQTDGAATLMVTGDSGYTIGTTTLNFTAGSSAAQSTTFTRSTDGSNSIALPSTTLGLARAGTPRTYTSSSVTSTGELPANTIVTGSAAFTGVTYGQPFKQGALAPSDALTSRQLNAMSYWPDGSVKHALVTRVVSGATSYSDTLTLGTAASGTTLTLADLKAALTQPVAFDGGAFGSASISGTDWDTAHTVVATGPLMSSWVHRKAFSGDSHLVAYVETRIWSTGAVEVFPWVENGYLTVATPTNKNATYTFTMGGTLRFSEAIDIKHHTRIPLVSTSTSEGSTTSFSHWLGTDPQARCVHDGAYIMASKAVPNMGWGVPSDAVLNAALQDYTPNTLAGDDNATGATGGGGSIISETSARYLTSNGDLRAWKAMLTHALSAGSWSWHYRDSSTQRPVLYSSYASNQIGDGTIPAGTGGTNHTAGPAMTHMPSYAYLPWLVTGRWWFLEELQFQTTWGFLSVTPAYRNNGDFTIGTRSGFNSRGGAWSMNLAAQAASVTPTSHPLSAQFIATWERTMAHLYGTYVSGTLEGGVWVSPQGILGTHNSTGNSDDAYVPPNPSTAWWDAGWMHNYLAAVLGYAWDIGLQQSGTSLTQHTAVRDSAYNTVIVRADDGLSGRYNWRRFTVFAYPVGTDDVGLPVETYFTAAQSYAELVSGYGLATIPSTYGLSLKQHSSDSDMTSGDTSRNYGGTGLAALSMAVEHGVAGATEGYLRITGASNYASAFTTWLKDDSPNWGVKPRVPSWVPAAGTVVDLTTNTINSAAGYTSNMWRAWSGVAYAPWWGTHGSLIASGEGHTDGTHNDVYRIDIGTRLITQIKPSATAFAKADTYIADQTTGWMWANSSGDTAVQTGEPFTPHFYGGLVALPPNFSPSGATNGALFTGSRTGMPLAGSRGSLAVHSLRMGVDTLWALHGAGTDLGGYQGYDFKCFDPTRNCVWYKTDRFGGTFQRWNLASNTQTNVSFTNGNLVDPYSAVAFYMAADDCIVNVFPGGGGHVMTVSDLAASTSYQPTLTGTAPTFSAANWAWGWSDAWRAVFYFDGGSTIYFLKPSGNVRTASWAWSSQSLTGTIRTGEGNGVFNRIRHVPLLGNVLVWAADARYPVQAIGVTTP